MMRKVARAFSSGFVALLIGVLLVMDWPGKPLLILVTVLGVVAVPVIVYRAFNPPSPLLFEDGHYYMPRNPGESCRRCVACGNERESIWGRGA